MEAFHVSDCLGQLVVMFDSIVNECLEVLRPTWHAKLESTCGTKRALFLGPIPVEQRHQEGKKFDVNIAFSGVFNKKKCPPPRHSLSSCLFLKSIDFFFQDIFRTIELNEILCLSCFFSFKLSGEIISRLWVFFVSVCRLTDLFRRGKRIGKISSRDFIIIINRLL